MHVKLKRFCCVSLCYCTIDIFFWRYRYNPSASVVVAAPKKIKAGRELQLPSMTLLTSKTSSQQFFLRILKVIIQLRDAAKIQVKRTARRGGKQEQTRV